MSFIARKGFYAYELQVGPLCFFWKIQKDYLKVTRWEKNPIDGSFHVEYRRFAFFTDPYA